MNDLPAPLTPKDCDLRDFAYMPLDVVRLRDAGITAIDPEAFRAAIISWCVAWHQRPAASLPDDDGQLCRLLGYGRDIKAWKKLRQAGALRGYVLCADGRLYHPVVAEKAIEAMSRKRGQRDRTEAARVARLSQRVNAHQSQGMLQTKISSVTEDVTDRTTDDVTASKGREGKGIEGKDSSLRSQRAGEDDPDFVRFWAIYPRKDDKGHARKAWLAARRKASADVILRGLRGYRFSDDPKFQPLAATWMNGERWNDAGSLPIDVLQTDVVERTPSNPTGRRISPMTGFA